MRSEYPWLIIWGWVAGAITLALFLQPSAGWRDGPEFAVSAWVLGISHPAGFPLYQSISWAFEQLPLADIIVRNHAFSTVFTLLSALLLYLAALSFLKYLSGGAPASQMEKMLAGWVSICWMVMPAQLENAVQSEAYSLHACFTFLICKLLFDFTRTREARRYVLAVFMAGLGAGNHATLGAFVFPLIIVLGVYSNFAQALRTALAGVAAGAWGLLTYLYLPVRSLREPSFDWGNPEIWARFWAQVLDRKDASGRFSELSDASNGTTDVFFSHFMVMQEWFGVLGLALILAGWIWLLVRHTRFALLSLTWMAFLFSFFLGWVSGTVLTGALGILLLGALPVIAGVVRWCDGHVKQRHMGVALAVAAAGLIFFSLYRAGVDYLARRTEYLPSELVRSQLLDLPYRATMLAGPSWFHLRSLSDLEGLRPDVTIIGLGDIISPQYFRPLKPHHVPLLKFPDLNLPDIGEPEDGLKSAFLKELFMGNAGRSQFYLELEEGYLHVFFNYIQPSNALWWARLANQPGQNDCSAMNSTIRASISRMLEERTSLFDPEFGDFLKFGYFSWFKVAMFRQPKCVAAGSGMLKWWLSWMRQVDIRQGAIYNDMGAVFAASGHERGARVMFQLADSLKNADGMKNLAVWHEKQGDRAMALEQYRKSFLAHGDPVSFQSYRRLLGH